MTNVEKVMEFMRETFGFDVKHPSEFTADMIDCEQCPVIGQCEIDDVCHLDEWMNQEFNEVAK